MAHPFIVAPMLSSLVRTTPPARRTSAPLPPSQSHADLGGLDFGFPSSDRSNSISPTDRDMNPAARRGSLFASPRNQSTLDANHVRTRSLGYGAGVVFEREAREPTDDDVIIVTVRLRNTFRKQSVDGADDLPSRYANTHVNLKIPPQQPSNSRLLQRHQLSSPADHNHDHFCVDSRLE